MSDALKAPRDRVEKALARFRDSVESFRRHAADKPPPAALQERLAKAFAPLDDVLAAIEPQDLADMHGQLEGLRAAHEAMSAALRGYEAHIVEACDIAAGLRQPGYDGQPPIITDAPQDGDNPQQRPTRNAREHPLDLMLHKGHLTPDQYGAGDRFRVDLELGEIGRIRSGRYESIHVGGSAPKWRKEIDADGTVRMVPVTFQPAKGKDQPSGHRGLADGVLDAMTRANRAYAAVVQAAGKPAAEIVVMVCRDRRSLRSIINGRQHGAYNTVAARFKAGLAALGEHYGLTGARRRQAG